MKRKKPPNLTLLREYYEYSPVTGLFIHKRSTARGIYNQVAGTKRPDGYIGIAINGQRWLAHHIAWYYIHNEWLDEIDHKDGNRSNNRLNNLRPATRTQNNGNSNGWGKRKKSGLPRGVYYHPGDKTRFRSQIYVNYKAVHLGCFDTINEAEKAYIEAARIHFGEFAKGGLDAS